MADEMWAYVVEGENGSTELVATKMDDQWFPMVFVRQRLAVHMEPRAREIARKTKKKVKLIRFSNSEVCKILE